MTRTIVHLVRHGEVHNPDKVLYGRLPGFVLSTAGEQMAQVVASALRDHDIAVLRTSPLDRARQTAQPLADLLGIVAEVDDRLIESDNVFEGTKEAWKQPSSWRHLYNPARPSWGEPFTEVAARMLAAAADARDAASGREAVLVSHQLPIWVTRRAVEGKRLWHRPDRRMCALASVTSIEYDGTDVTRVGYQEPAGPLGRRTVGGA